MNLKSCFAAPAALLLFSVSAGPDRAAVDASRFSSSLFVHHAPTADVQPVLVLPPPAALTAVPQWAASCPKCGGMAMGHIALTWLPVRGAPRYKIYRDGTLLPERALVPSYTDMAVTGGQVYSYAVAADGRGVTGPKSKSVTATAPTGPALPSGPTLLSAPTNLSVSGVWQGASTDTLSWDRSPGAVTYNLYQYDTLLTKGISGTTYTVPTAAFNSSVTYTVTAVDAMGQESIPSAIAGAIGAHDPTKKPSWTPAAPITPTNVSATAEWNGGLPRLRLAWQGSSRDSTYTVYRDGIRVASGLWGLTYFDSAVVPGLPHTYTVSGVNVPWVTPVESAPSDPVSGVVPLGTPATAASDAKVEITSVASNDDSVRVFFKPVPGAADYRVINSAKPGTVKYTGWFGTGRSSDMVKNRVPALPPPDVLSIEVNGLNPANGADLMIEAVDKLGPFQKMDGSMGPGAMSMDGMTMSAINGQGDPSNLPTVVAHSDTFHVSCQPHALGGEQVFFDTFRGSTPFAAAPLEPAVAAQSNPYGEISGIENDKWRIRTYGGDTDMTRSFVMSNHFMDTLYDGPTASHRTFSHNNNSALVMLPKATADISDGKVLHVTFEVDAHFDGRRWCDVFIGEAGDPLLRSAPSKLGPKDLPTAKGNLFVWQIQNSHTVELITPQRLSDGTIQHAVADLYQPTTYNDSASMSRDIYAQVFHHHPYANGSPLNLDNRSRFDLYLSRSHYRIVETLPDGMTQLVRERDFPAGVTLPFTNCQVYFVHELYHTGNDRPEQMGEPSSAYWYNSRPWCDERHWDNMGFEVLQAFPQ